MAHLIDKDTLVAVIEGRMKILTHEMNKFYYASNYNEWKFAANEYKSLISFINTLKVKEVDLEKESASADLERELCDYFEGWRINYYSETEELLKNNGCTVDIDDVKEIARHFFELGLKARKG